MSRTDGMEGESTITAFGGLESEVSQKAEQETSTFTMSWADRILTLPNFNLDMWISRRVAFYRSVMEDYKGLGYLVPVKEAKVLDETYLSLNSLRQVKMDRGYSYAQILTCSSDYNVEEVVMCLSRLAGSIGHELFENVVKLRFKDGKEGLDCWFVRSWEVDEINPVQLVATRSLQEGEFDSDIPKFIGREGLELTFEKWLLPTPRPGSLRLPIVYHDKLVFDIFVKPEDTFDKLAETVDSFTSIDKDDQYFHIGGILLQPSDRKLPLLSLGIKDGTRITMSRHSEDQLREQTSDGPSPSKDSEMVVRMEQGEYCRKAGIIQTFIAPKTTSIASVILSLLHLAPDLRFHLIGTAIQLCFKNGSEKEETHKPPTWAWFTRESACDFKEGGSTAQIASFRGIRDWEDNDPRNAPTGFLGKPLKLTFQTPMTLSPPIGSLKLPVWMNGHLIFHFFIRPGETVSWMRITINSFKYLGPRDPRDRRSFSIGELKVWETDQRTMAQLGVKEGDKVDVSELTTCHRERSRLAVDPEPPVQPVDGTLDEAIASPDLNDDNSKTTTADSILSSLPNAQEGHSQTTPPTSHQPPGLETAPTVITTTTSPSIPRTYLTAPSLARTYLTADTTHGAKPPAPPPTLHIQRLTSLSLLPSLLDEKDWSGHGMHVEYTRPNHPPDPALLPGSPPLTHLHTIGSSGPTIVDAVRCRRVVLARKSVQTTRKLSPEWVLREVAVLQKLAHPHLVQLVGTYLQGRTLAILLYPAAKYNLADFMDECETWFSSIGPRRDFEVALTRFPVCLANALAYIHAKNVKHMDIKPKNILVRQRRMDPEGTWFVYLADFGISRDFSDQGQSQDVGPHAYTPVYVAPEVKNWENWGRAADVFSLGAVFAEVGTVRQGRQLEDFVECRVGGDGGESFWANLGEVGEWIGWLEEEGERASAFGWGVVRMMLMAEPGERPVAEEVVKLWPKGEWESVDCCSEERETYEVDDGGEFGE